MSVAKQYKNRRENVLINDIPPEILTEAKLSADGYVKNTDYATNTKGGVLKSNTNNFYVTTAGVPQCGISTAAQYASLNNNVFIGKGTLENVFPSKFIAELQEVMLAAADVLDPDNLPVGTVISDFKMTKTADGFVLTATKTEPETP